MNRRTFVAAVSAIIGAPLAATGQRIDDIRRLGVLIVGSPLTTVSEITAFREGLREHGYVDGQNIAIEYRYSDGNAVGAGQLVAELIRANVSIIVAAGGPLALAAKKATVTIPIVFVAAGDPVGFGIVPSLSRPGGNTTGLSMIVDAGFIGKWAELLRQATPNISSVGYIHDLNMRLASRSEEGRTAAAGLNIGYVEVRGLHDIDKTFARMSKDRGGVVVPPQPFFFTHRSEIVQLAAKHRLPAIYGFRDFVDAGGLMSYGVSLPAVWRQASTYVNKILRGGNPADIPIEQPTTFELIVNLKTARALGLTVPPSLLLRADHLIE